MSNKKKRQRVLITGGPTRAYLDRVRFLSNVSTGWLAFEICRNLKKQGFDVAAVVGPCSPPFEELALKGLVRVETTEEMTREVIRLCRSFRPHTAIFSAAVLDFAPTRVESKKVSSQRKDWTVRMKPTPKIIDLVGKKYPTIKRIGFKLESEMRKGAALRKFADAYRGRKGLYGLCLNFLPEVSRNSHRAHLFAADGKHTIVSTKAGIARWLASHS